MSDNIKLVDLHQNVCKELGLNDDIGDLAWEGCKKIRENYSLDDKVGDWVAVAIYSASCNSLTNEFEDSLLFMETDAINVPKLLRLCNTTSYLSFIKNSKSWIEMAELSPEFKIRIDNLEHAFAITNVLFKKYMSIFTDLFGNPYSLNEESAEDGSKNCCSVLCDIKRLAEFGWTLFLSVKMKYTSVLYDLVNCYHLLLACCDYIYSNCVSSDRRDLLNRSFSGVPKNFFDDDYDPPQSPICVINDICAKHDGLTLDAKTVKQFTWKLNVQSYFDRGLLRGNRERLNGVLEDDVFAYNYSSINRHYEFYAVSVGFCDERQFIVDLAADDLTSPTVRMMSQVPVSDFSRYLENLRLKKASSTVEDIVVPEMANKYLQYRFSTSSTHKSDITQIVTKLNRLVGNSQPVPRNFLLAIMRSCDESLVTGIQKLVDDMSNTILNYFSKIANKDRLTCELEVANTRVEYVKKLYYKVLENILLDESKFKTESFKQLMNFDVFHKTLFACCLEIVIYTCNLQPSFLWVFEVLKVHGFHFYKIIELIVRTGKNLSRDVVKHLNAIEDQILDSISWQEGSPLWNSVSCKGAVSVPSCFTVAIPHNQITTHYPSTGSYVTLNTIGNQPQTHNVDKKFLANILRKNVAEQPKTNDNSEENYRNKGLDIFFRKFYNLASMRMFDICDQLNITSEETRRLIWTCFEFVIMNSTDLMLNRHLDQIMMCCIYVIARTVDANFTFQLIMKAYRNQPQASPHIYRNVLLLPDTVEVSAVESMLSLANSDSTPGKPLRVESLRRGDIIQFYNLIFVKAVQLFINRMNTNNEGADMALSPLPFISPRNESLGYRVSETNEVYVRLIEITPPILDVKSTFVINKSPSSDLSAINEMIRMNFDKKRNFDGTLKVGSTKIKSESVLISTAITTTTSSESFTTSSRLQDLIQERGQSLKRQPKR